MTTIGRIEQLTTFSGGYVETLPTARPQTYAATREVIPVDREDFKAALERLKALEREVTTLKDQMKVAASLIKERH